MEDHQHHKPLPVAPAVPHAPLVQPPAQLDMLVLPTQPGQQAHGMLNQSHFRPEFSGKPEEDAEAHLCRTNYWMETHNFPEEVKVQRFCLTLTEVRLCYESLRPIVIDWQGLQDQFRHQYSKIGNTGEQLFHAWRSFHYDENTETLDTYVTRIRQVAALLGYGEPHILDVFKILYLTDCIGLYFLLKI